MYKREQESILYTHHSPTCFVYQVSSLSPYSLSSMSSSQLQLADTVCLHNPCSSMCCSRTIFHILVATEISCSADTVLSEWYIGEHNEVKVQELACPEAEATALRANALHKRQTNVCGAVCTSSLFHCWVSADHYYRQHVLLHTVRRRPRP